MLRPLFMLLEKTSNGASKPTIEGCPKFQKTKRITLKSTTEKHAVRCCAKDGQSCVSDCGFQTYEDAKKTCENKNRRLCKATELGNCCGTGCNYDTQPTWIAGLNS